MKKTLIFLGTFSLFLIPLSGFAAEGFFGSIVPDRVLQCAPYCEACDLVALFDNVLRFAVYFSAIVATLMFAYAGFLYVTASAKQDNISQAKKIFGDVLTGFIFILGAWLIINVIMSVFVEEKAYPWNEIKCEGYAEVKTPLVIPNFPPPIDSDLDGNPDSPFDTSTECLDCVNLVGIPTKGGIGGQINSDLKGELEQLGMDEYGMRVTEAYPPTTDHQRACHYNGTCVDAGFATDEERTAANINKAIRSSSGTNLTLVYEVPTATRRAELVSQGVPPDQVIVVPGISAEHFSIYCETCGKGG